MTPAPLDIAVAATVAKSIRNFMAARQGSASGLEFERIVYDAMFGAHPWHHAAAPDQFDMSLPITSRTGVRYEFDGVFTSSDTLYVIEAKHLAGERLTREHVGIFVQKLFDTVLGSYDEIGHLAIKPLIASALPHVDVAARRHAMAWGILLLTPADVTPLEILAAIMDQQGTDAAIDYLSRECTELAAHLWRPFNDILCPADTNRNVFTVYADKIRDASQVAQLLEHGDECRLSAESLGILTPQVAVQTARNAR